MPTDTATIKPGDIDRYLHEMLGEACKMDDTSDKIGRMAKRALLMILTEVVKYLEGRIFGGGGK